MRKENNKKKNEIDTKFKKFSGSGAKNSIDIKSLIASKYKSI